jgi:hypothetical protein
MSDESPPTGAARQRQALAQAEKAVLASQVQRRAAAEARGLAAMQRARAQAMSDSVHALLARLSRRAQVARRVMVFIEDPVRLAHACALLRADGCNVVAFSDLVAAAAELDSDRPIDQLIVDAEEPDDGTRGPLVLN